MEYLTQIDDVLIPNEFKRVNSIEMMSRNLEEYYVLKEDVGQGTYGKVYKASAKDNLSKIYALKYIDTSREKEGFPITALREIKLLQGLSHENILNIVEIVIKQSHHLQNPRASTFIVLDYMEYDLQGLLMKNMKFGLPEIKCIAFQLLKGLQYLHSKNIIHRDLKPANLLMNQAGILKIADFGLAKILRKSSKKRNTITVVTLWYRAPEILLGDYFYDEKSDVWSVGCILYEIMTGKPLFSCQNEKDQITKIIQVCGYPDRDQWPDIEFFKYKSLIDDIPKSENKLKQYLIEKIPEIDEYGCLFMQQLLSLNPAKRLSSEEAVNHIFFKTEPLPSQPGQIQKPKEECHNLKQFNCKKNVENPNKQDYMINQKFGQVQKPNSYHQLNQQNANYNKNNNYYKNTSYFQDQSKYEDIHKKYKK